jgi:endonuclease/exonuclease/phosphatase family metal-dependent hydrolase
MTIRLLTYNIHHGADKENHLALDAIMETIRQSGADIIALQEVDRVWDERSDNCDEARYIAANLGMNFAFGAALDICPAAPGVGEYGVMILSRFAIADHDCYLLPGRLEQRVVLRCTIRTLHGDMPVCCTHLGLSGEERAGQIAAMLEWLPQQENLILMGDFNTAPAGPELQPLYSRFDDLQEKSGWGGVGTYYYNQQWVRVDYIFSGRFWKPWRCRVIDPATSDHLPVYVEAGPAGCGVNRNAEK